MRPTALDDVLVEGEHHVRRELSRPCVKVLGQSVLFKPLVPVGERAGIDLVLFEKSSCVLSESNSNIVSSSMPNFSSATLGCPLRNEGGTSKERRSVDLAFCTDPWKNHLPAYAHTFTAFSPVSFSSRLSAASHTPHQARCLCTFDPSARTQPPLIRFRGRGHTLMSLTFVELGMIFLQDSTGFCVGWSLDFVGRGW